MYHESVKYIYFNDDIVPYEEARVHVLTPAMRYGAVVFEGIRGYWNEESKELYVLHLRKHMERLIQSAKLMDFIFDYSVDMLCQLTIETIKKNQLRKDIHIRPIIYLGGSGEAIDQPPVGRLAGQALLEHLRAGAVPDGQLERRVVSHAVLIVLMGIAQGQRVDVVPQQFGVGVADAVGIPRVIQPGGQVCRQTEPMIHFAEQQRSGVRSDSRIGLTQLDGSVKRRLQ